MSRKEFESRQEELRKQLLGYWSIHIGDESLADFEMGCFFDENSGQWKVYRNLERGMNMIRIETQDEEKAFEELYAMIKFQIGVIERRKKKS